MRTSGDRGFGEDETEDGTMEVEDDRSGDVVLDTEAEVACPHCGEVLVMGLDPAGGRAQEYVEDCHVCCRPCRVRVSYDDRGTAEVWVEAMQ
jgi:hypothetical protein